MTTTTQFDQASSASPVRVATQGDSWLPCRSSAPWTNATDDLAAAGFYSHFLTRAGFEPTPALASGVFVVYPLKPFNQLGLRFAGAKSSDPKDGQATGRLWLLDDSTLKGIQKEFTGEFAIDLALTCGDKELVADSELRSLGSSFTYKWVDTVAGSNDKTFNESARNTGGIGDDIQSIWVDGRGARGFVLQIKGDSLTHILPQFKLL